MSVDKLSRGTRLGMKMPFLLGEETLNCRRGGTGVADDDAWFEALGFFPHTRSSTRSRMLEPSIPCCGDEGAALSGPLLTPGAMASEELCKRGQRRVGGW